MEPHVATPSALVELTDLELVRRVLDGETVLFELIMRRHNRKVFRAVRSILKDPTEVEDVMQQAYIAAFTHLGDFAGNAQFSTWLIRIAMNEAYGRLRRGRRLVLVEHPAPSARAETATPEEAYMSQELASLIERAVDALPEIYRSVYMMRQIEELSTAETASLLDTTEEVVKTRLHRAKALLHARLADLTDEHASSAFSFDGGRCDRLVARVLAHIASVR